MLWWILLFIIIYFLLSYITRFRYKKSAPFSIKCNKYIISDNPLIFEINNYLNKDICIKYINKYRDICTDSLTEGKKKSRKSKSVECYLDNDNFLKSKILKQLDSNFRYNNIEPFQFIRYDPGDYYKYHYDLLHNLSYNGYKQRVASVIIYLNSNYSGGRTCFKTNNLEINPTTGKCILFYNCDAHGIPNDKTLHRGAIVEDGTKYILVSWIWN